MWKNHTQSASQHHFYCFLKAIWILKSGCSLKSPTQAKIKCAWHQYKCQQWELTNIDSKHKWQNKEFRKETGLNHALVHDSLFLPITLNNKLLSSMVWASLLVARGNTSLAIVKWEESRKQLNTKCENSMVQDHIHQQPCIQTWHANKSWAKSITVLNEIVSWGTTTFWGVICNNRTHSRTRLTMQVLPNQQTRGEKKKKKRKIKMNSLLARLSRQSLWI